MISKYTKTAGLLSLSLACISCSNSTSTSDVDGIIDIGKPTEKTDMPEDYYTGGELGTVFNLSSAAYEQPAPAIEKQGLSHAFSMGE